MHLHEKFQIQWGKFEVWACHKYMHCLFCLFGCDHIVSVPSHGPHVPPFPPPSCWYNWKAIMRWCAVCTFVDLQKTFVSENQCLILNWFFTMGFHKNSEMKPIQPSSSVGMGDLCRRVWHTWATLICQLEIVTKAYGLIQTTYMVLLWLLILPIILALKVAWSINCTITFQTQLAFFFSPKRKSVKMVHYQYSMISPLYHMENIN